jgi:hypothetical protein
MPFGKTWNSHGVPSYESYAFEINPLGTDSSAIQFINGYSGCVDQLSTGSGAVPDLTWTHVVGVYDPAAAVPQKKLYINGSLNVSKTFTGAMVYDTGTTGDLYIGSNGAPEFFFKGNIADVRIYNRALAATEIAALYGGQ